MEAYTYTGATVAASAQELHLLSIDIDSSDLCPKDLDEKFNQWDPIKGRKPTLLYGIPCGQNPMGVTQPAEQRRSIYGVTIKHGLYIEGDPYYFPQLETAATIIFVTRCGWQSPAHGYPFQDSCSGPAVWLSHGLQPNHRQVSGLLRSRGLPPAGPSQVVAYKLLDEAWGHEVFCNGTGLSLRYKRRRDGMITAFDRFLSKGSCTWDAPEIGMFIWVRLGGQ